MIGTADSKEADLAIPDYGGETRLESPQSAYSAIAPELLAHIGTVLKTLGHPVRLQIIQFLANGEERVSDIQTHIGLMQAATSHQLGLMKSKGILTSRREGATVYYSLANDFILKILDCLETLNNKVLSGEWSMSQIGLNMEGENDE